MRLYLAEETDAAWPQRDGRRPLPVRMPPQIGSFRQEGGGLGSRMQHAFTQTFAAGYHRAVIVGTDHPSLPRTFIEEAFERLESDDDIVIGPAEDGGYYLLGMREAHPLLFEEMEYGHGTVFDETMQRIGKTAARAGVLQPWYDVDRPDDLKRLVRDLDASSGAAPRTHAILLDLCRKYAWLAGDVERAEHSRCD